MLEQYLLPPRKPFYRRTWFLVLFVILLVAGLIAGGIVLMTYTSYMAQASKFDYGRLNDMEAATVVYDRNNKVLGRFFLENRDPVTLEQMPPRLKQAVVAAEDARFWSHHGIDAFGIARAVVRNKMAGRNKEGASTLTQQLARNTFPKQLPAGDKTYERKLLEMAVARQIEERLQDKNKIIELYLNRVYFGGSFYGVQAASRGYFGKDVSELSLSECAMLCGLLRNPNNLSPWTNHQACMDNRDRVLNRMLELEMISRKEYDATKGEELMIKNRRSIYTQSYALDMVRQQLMKQVGEDSAFSDGYRVFTTLDGNLQKVAEESLRRQLSDIEGTKGYAHTTLYKYREGLRSGAVNPAKSDPDYLQGALVVLDNKTGGVLTLIGGRDFAHSQYNRVLSSARPAGTAFKPLVYASAFEQGFFPGSLVDDSAMDNRQVMIGGTTGILGEWGPERSDNLQYEGLIPAREALVKSKNAATVRLGQAIGLDKVINFAGRAGISAKLSKYPRTFLGSSEVTLMDMALAYTSFANVGWRPAQPFIITKIEDKEGQTTFQQKLDEQRVMPPPIAAEINSCLSEVLETGTGDKAFSRYGLRKFPVAGETGTAYNFTDAWFLGYSSEVTCGVWAGFDKPRTSIYSGAFSSDLVLPVWVDVMNASFDTYKPQPFPVPDDLKTVKICRTSGQLATPECHDDLPSPEGAPAIQRSTASMELATREQTPKVNCTVHSASPQSPSAAILPGGNGGATTAGTGLPPSQWPRAALAADVTNVTPVMMQSATVLVSGDDPYQSVKPVTVLPAIRVDTGETPKTVPGETPPTLAASATPPPASTSSEPKVMRAEPVRALDQNTADPNTIKIEPPPALKFE